MKNQLPGAQPQFRRNASEALDGRVFSAVIMRSMLDETRAKMMSGQALLHSLSGRAAGFPEGIGNRRRG